MKTYCDSNAGSQIAPVLWNARESVWIVSPWLGKDYAKRLVTLSQKEIEVRIITSNEDFNKDSIEILKAGENKNLLFLVLDKNRLDEKATFIHSKLYIVDKLYGISGSANLTFSGLNSNVESLNITETKEEVKQLEIDFMRLWMNFERKSMSKEELTSGTSHSIRNALPLSDLWKISQPHLKSRQLVYHPYYFFEFMFRGSVRSPPLLFEDSGLIVLDGVTRQITNDNLLAEEINNHPKSDYIIKTEDKYSLRIDQPAIRNYQEAKELVLNNIIKKNTRYYNQYYGSRSYERLFVPRRYDISFVKSDFIQVPIWYVEIHEPDGSKYQNILFGSSGKKWNQLIYCPECQRKIWINEALNCERCGKKVCNNCISELGFIFKKRICKTCLICIKTKNN